MSILPIRLPSIEQGQFLQDFELSDCVIAGSSGLLSLDALDPNADVGSSYHVHIIGAVPDSQCRDSRLIPPHESDYLLLLFGRHPTRYDTIAFLSNPHEFRGIGLVYRMDQSVAADYQGEERVGLSLGIQLLETELQSRIDLFGSQSVDDDPLHVLGKQSAREADVYCRFDLVACQHPDFYPGGFEGFYRVAF